MPRNRQKGIVGILPLLIIFIVAGVFLSPNLYITKNYQLIKDGDVQGLLAKGGDDGDSSGSENSGSDKSSSENTGVYSRDR